MAQKFYLGASIASTGEWIGWMGANENGNVQFYGANDPNSNPAELKGVEILMWENDGGNNYLRAPAYFPHGSAYLGGTGDNGYYASWRWREGLGYPVNFNNNQIVIADIGKILSFYGFMSRKEASWEDPGASTILVFKVQNV